MGRLATLLRPWRVRVEGGGGYYGQHTLRVKIVRFGAISGVTIGEVALSDKPALEAIMVDARDRAQAFNEEGIR